MSTTRHRLFNRRTLVVLAVVSVVAAAAVVWLVVRDDDEPGRLEAAVALAPEASERIGWTDWAGVRRELDTDLTASSTAAEVEEFLLAGFDADLTSASALVTSASTLQEQYGVSPATLEWELFAQSREAALLFLGLPESLDLGDLRDDLEALGYQRPDTDDGVWLGGGDVVARVGGVTEQLGYLVVDAERRLLVASDSQTAADRWRDGQRGTESDDGVAEVVAQVGGALAATVYTGEHACVALSMTQASDDDRVRAAELVDAAGEVSPVLGFAIAGRPGGEVRVAMAFETEEQARANADARFALARGPAPGQGTDFPDLFEVGEGDVAARGTVVTMDLRPQPYSFVLSDLAQGPVLFATC